MKRNPKRTISVVIFALLFAALLSCNRQQPGSSAVQGVAVTKEVSGVTLAVTPQYGPEESYPQPATSYTTNPAYPNQPAFSNENGFPIVEEKVTLRVAHPYYSYVTDYENNDMTRYMEALTNIHIDWELLPEVDTMEKINLMFSAGDQLPDVFFACALPGTMLVTLGASKLVLPLSDLIEKHGFNMKQLYEQRPEVYAVMKSADGNIYSLGSFGVNDANRMAMRFWVNKTFLDTLGMKVPTTTDELYEYLKAVKTRDPNGNGRADEIPLIGATEGWHQQIDGFLMNAFIYNETSTDRNPVTRRRVFLTDDGKIDVSFTKPEWKQGLEYMHKLYAEGLLAGESFTIKKEDLRALVEYEDAFIVGSLPSGGPHEFSNTRGERRKEFIPIPPLKGPNGVQQIWYDEYAGPGVGAFSITKDSKIPDIAMKWADYTFNQDYRTRNRLGVLGRDWRIPPEGTIAVDGGPSLYEEILKWGTPQNAYWGRGINWSEWTTTKTARTGDPWELDLRLWNAYLEYRPYAYRKSVPREMAFTVEESRQYNELNTRIVEYVEQSLARFVTGDLNLDRDWNQYLTNLDQMGLKDLIALTQTGFDRSWKETLGY
jgi:putative aldouronate transport system substrate-binding protein